MEDVESAKARKKIAELTSQLIPVEYEFSRLRSWLSDRRHMLQLTEQRIAKLSAEFEETKKAIEVDKKRIKLLGQWLSQNNDWREFMLFAEQESGRLKNEARDFQDNLLKILTGIENLKKEKAKLEDEVSSLEEKERTLGDKVQTIKSEISRLRGEVGD